ncbi:SatD family protein [Microbacterium sp. NM3R9]|uniref:SatD family protein n=1 Tax=Microbacterium thalli TaxID=3027921 RepID=UPI0023653BEC|nr:SatD family protein [Microbacterium thalli]MDN8548425.1 SatD family protein [Microbacterium thalli]
MTVAVIADIVGSRRLDDRSRTQRQIEETVEQVDAVLPVAVSPMRATFADEFQAVFDDLDDTLAWLLLLQLGLPEGVALRFGVGVGEVGEVDSATAAIADGPGWWRAREAIDEVHALQDRAVPRARTRIVGGDDEDVAMADRIRFANAYLLARDELVGAMSERARRLTYGRCLGRTQGSLAADEGITQSAVSQLLASSGAPSIIAGYTALTEASR